MTSRERVFAALAHQQPDRCPVDLLLENTTARVLMEHFGVRSEQELHDILQSDIQFVFPDSTLPPIKPLDDGTWYDHAGSRFRRVETAADKPLSAYSEEELIALWQAAKEKES